MTHPYSIYIWQPEKHGGCWIEPVQAYTQEYAIYVANLIHQNTRSVIKVVRYGITIAAFPNKETVERIEGYGLHPFYQTTGQVKSPEKMCIL